MSRSRCPACRRSRALPRLAITSLCFAPALWAQAAAGAGAAAKPQVGGQTDETTTLPVFEVRTDKDEDIIENRTRRHDSLDEAI